MGKNPFFPFLSYSGKTLGLFPFLPWFWAFLQLFSEFDVISPGAEQEMLWKTLGAFPGKLGRGGWSFPPKSHLFSLLNPAPFSPKSPPIPPPFLPPFPTSPLLPPTPHFPFPPAGFFQAMDTDQDGTVTFDLLQVPPGSPPGLPWDPPGPPQLPLPPPAVAPTHHVCLSPPRPAPSAFTGFALRRPGPGGRFSAPNRGGGV